jgi:hypothetical protein
MPSPQESLEVQGILATEPANGSNNIGLSVKPKITFDTVMDKAPTERSIAFFKGKYDPASNPATFTPLQLTSMCSGRWRVRNPNTLPLSFNWDIYKHDEKGVGVVPGSSDVFFTTSPGSRTVRLFVGTKQQQVKASNNAACKDSLFTFTWSPDSKSVSFKPNEAFMENTDYTVVLSTGAKGATGAAFTSPYVLKFKTGSQVIGPLVLQPKGSVTGIDNIVVDAKNANFNDATEFSITRVDNTSTLPPFSYSLPIALTNYYQITSPKRSHFGSGQLTVHLPHPEGTPTDGLSVAFLLPSNEVRSEPTWAFLPATYSPSTNEILFGLKQIDPKGLVFVIVKGGYIPTTTSRLSNQSLTLEAQATGPTFKAQCSDKFQLPEVRQKSERCGEAEIAAAEKALSEAYNLYKGTYNYSKPALYQETNPDNTLGAYIITIEPASKFASNGLYVNDLETAQKYGYEVGQAVVAIGSDGFTTAKVGTIFHEVNHSFVWAYPSVNGFDYTGDAGYFIEGFAALAKESRSTLQSSDAYDGYGARPLDVSLLAPAVAKCPNGGNDCKEQRYAYQVQRFFEWMAEADPAGAEPNLEYFLKFLESTGNSAIDALPAWDPKRMDYVIRNGTGFKDGLGEVYQGFIQDQLTTATGKVYIDPNLPGIQEISLTGEGTFSTDIVIESLSTTLVKIRIPAGKTAQDLLADFRQLKGVQPLILYTANGGYLYVAFISGDITPLEKNNPSTTGKYNIELMELSGAWSSSFGDPHIASPDLNRYSFQAVGDYVLTRSTDPEDTFEIQVRYTPFNNDGRQWSGENALAMMVGADVVELYAQTNSNLDIFVNGESVTVNSNSIFALEKGSISRTEKELSVSWNDGTLLVASLTSPDPTKALRGFTKVYFPPTRRTNVEGLLGNFDGDPANDFQIRGGQTLSEPTELELYIGGYRDSWSVQRGASESLFSQGGDPYDATYPGNLVTFDDFFVTQVENANQTCRAEGITDSFFLRACALDILVTGNPAWAENAAAASVGLALFTPSITINPPAVTLVKSEGFSFEAIVRGSTSDVVWESSAGSIISNGKMFTFNPPVGGGEYILTAKLANDPAYITTAKIIVAEPVKTDGPYKIDLGWGSSRYGSVNYDAHLWLPNNNGCHISPNNRGSATTMPFATFDQEGYPPPPYGPGGSAPELITVHKRLNTGQYEYAVFGNGPTSPYVSVTLPDGSVRSFYRSSATGSGNWWHVFTIDALTGNLITVNALLDSYAPYSDTNNSGCNP